MKKNKGQPKSSDRVRKSRNEKLSIQTDGNTKKGRKVQKKKKQKTTRNREIFQAVLPGIRYCNGQWVKQKTIEVMDVSVMKSASEDLEGIGNERLVLWKMSAEETEELKQQVKQEALHKKRQNIMPLVLQMSKDQIETAYEGIVKQWNIPDNLPSEGCEDKSNCDDNTSDEESRGEKQLPRIAEASSLDSRVSLAYDNSGCDIMPDSECSELDENNCNMRSSTEDLRISDEGESPLAEMECCCDSVGAIVQQLVSTEAEGLEPENGDNSQIVLQSFGESPVATQLKPDQFSGEDFVAPLLIENSLVSKPNKLGDEVSRKFQDSNSEETKSKESVSSVSDKYQLDDCNSDSVGNQSMLCSSIPDSVVTSDHSFTNIKTTISTAEICNSDSAAAVNDTCNTETPEIKNDLNLSPKLIKRKRSTKAEYAKKMKFYVDDLSCLVSESLKTRSQAVILTTDYASDKNSAMTPTNPCTVTACTIDQTGQAVSPNKESGLECTALIKECSTSISINCGCDVKKSWDNETETQMKELSLDPRRSPNKTKGHVNLEPKIGSQFKPLEDEVSRISIQVHENVSFFQPTLGNKPLPDMSKPDLGMEKKENVSKQKNTNGSCRKKKNQKQRNYASTESRYKDSVKGCDQNLESAQKNHLNPALDKKIMSGKVTKSSLKPVTRSHVHYPVAEKDLHLTEDVPQHAVLGSKESFSECLKEEYVSVLTASQVKRKAKTRVLAMQEKSKIKDVIPLESELKQKHVDKLLNHVLEQGKVNTNSNVQKVTTANHANRRQVKPVKNKGKKQVANNLKLFQPQVCEYNTRNKKTSQKSSPCDIEVAVSCRSITSSTTLCNLGQTGIHGGNNKTKDGKQDSDLHQAENLTNTDKGKVTTKDTELCQSEVIRSSDNKELSANNSGPSQTEIIESSSKTKDFGLLQIEVTGVDSASREDTFRDLSMNQKSSKSNAVLHTISAKSKHEKAHKRTSNRLQRKSSHKKDWDQDTQGQENLGGRTSFSTQNELDAKYSGHNSLDTNKTELDYTNHASTDIGKRLNDKMPCSETKNDTDTDKLEVLTKCSMKLKTSKHDSQKKKNCCNTAVAQIEATMLSVNSFPVAEKLVLHAADDLTSMASNHDNIQDVAVSLNICSSAVEEQMKGDPLSSVHDEHNKEHVFCKSEKSLCHAVSQLTLSREIDLKESHRPPQLMAVDGSTVSRNEHLLSQSKDDSSEVKHDSCTSSDVSKNDCLVTRSGNFRVLDYSNSSNSELPDCGHLLSSEVISSINNNCSSKAISPIRSPSSSPSAKVDPRQYINGKPLRLKEPVAIPLMVEDPKVRNLLEYMCKAEILRLLGDD